MNDRSVFHLISDLTQKEGISCVLIGGFAVNYYRVTRQTADVDLLIAKEDYGRIAGALEKAGYRQVLTHENFVQLESSRRSLLGIDFMFVDRDVLTAIINEGESFLIAGQKFIVPSLYHLIALKLHSIKYNPKLRLMRDFPDIVNLMSVNAVDPDNEEFKAVCLKYGTPELYKNIRDALK